jgi:hypothetical protein
MDASQARIDTKESIGSEFEDDSYITEELLSEIRENPVDLPGEVVPEKDGVDTSRLLGIQRTQVRYRAWVYKPVYFKSDNKYAFYWYENGHCSGRAGYRNFDTWQKVAQYCSVSGDQLWIVYWWA